MFIVADAHQRIYDNHVSLAKVGINVRGRSRRLTVNYRTAQEIRALAVPALGKAPVTGLDDEADSLTGYNSPLHGRRPEVHAARSREAELAALAERVRGWIGEGIEPHAIGIAARAGYMAEQAAATLKAAGIPVTSLTAKSAKDAARVGTMHRMKGLEFQAVAVIGVADGVVPAPAAVIPAETCSPTRRICSASGACCSSLARGRETTCTSPIAAPRAPSSHGAKFKSAYHERSGVSLRSPQCHRRSSMPSPRSS